MTKDGVDERKAIRAEKAGSIARKRRGAQELRKVGAAANKPPTRDSCHPPPHTFLQVSIGLGVGRVRSGAAPTGHRPRRRPGPVEPVRTGNTAREFDASQRAAAHGQHIPAVPAWGCGERASPPTPIPGLTGRGYTIPLGLSLVSCRRSRFSSVEGVSRCSRRYCLSKSSALATSAPRSRAN